MKRKIKIFISYAHRNKVLATRFSNKFIDYISASKKYEYEVWSDLELMVGQDWNEKIQKNLKDCQACILLISPSFLNSKYIKVHEIPVLMNLDKVILPIGFSKIDFNRHDLLGFEKYQIFRLISTDFKDSRFYEELKTKRKMYLLKNFLFN